MLADHYTCYAVDILTLAQHQQDLTDDELDELYEATPNSDDGLDDENDIAGEGSSSAATLRIRKVGKKKGEKLRRKEQLRQYREVRIKSSSPIVWLILSFLQLSTWTINAMHDGLKMKY